MHGIYRLEIGRILVSLRACSIVKTIILLWTALWARKGFVHGLFDSKEIYVSGMEVADSYARKCWNWLYCDPWMDE